MSQALRSLTLAVLVVLSGCAAFSPGPSTTERVTSTPTAESTETQSPIQGEILPIKSEGAAWKIEAARLSAPEAAEEIAKSPTELSRHNIERAVIVREAGANGTTSRIGLSRELDREFDGKYVVLNGSYYRVNATVDWSHAALVDPVRVEGPLENRPSRYHLDSYREQAVNYSELPPAERRFVNTTLHRVAIPFDEFESDVGLHYFKNGTIPESSNFSTVRPFVVRYKGKLWSVKLDSEQSTVSTWSRVTYRLEPVAGSDWPDYVRENLTTPLENVSLSRNATDLLKRAMQNGSARWRGTPENEPQGLERLRDEFGRPRYLRHNGTIYRIEMSKSVGDGRVPVSATATSDRRAVGSPKVRVEG